MGLERGHPAHAQARHLGLLATAAIAIGLSVCAAGSKSLPPGEALAIVTETEPPVSNACLQALLSGVVMTRSGSEVVFKGGMGPITWPYGTKVVLVDGEARLYSPDGTLIATEGHALPDMSGGMGVDGRFHVCSFG